MEKLTKYLKDAIETTKTKEQELIHSDRKDEANLQRIRSNIYDICLTVLNVTVKANNGENFWEDYLHRLDNISQNWTISYEKAMAHNDVEKILIEETKFQVLNEVKEKCRA